jgi:hypothetical protein
MARERLVASSAEAIQDLAQIWRYVCHLLDYALACQAGTLKLPIAALGWCCVSAIIWLAPVVATGFGVSTASIGGGLELAEAWSWLGTASSPGLAEACFE